MSHRRSIEDDRRLKKLYDETKNGYACGAYYCDRKNRLIKYSCHNKWLKEHCRRITRRKLNSDDCLGSKGSYKKIYDYWWEII